MLESKGDPAIRLSAKAVAIVSAIVWGASILLVGLINLAAPAYGVNFLRGLSSVYPGFHASRRVRTGKRARERCGCVDCGRVHPWAEVLGMT